MVRPQIPGIPGFMRFPLRLMYEAHYTVIIVFRALLTTLYRLPLFHARCASVGKNLTIGDLPFVSGHVHIEIGDDVLLGGKLSIVSGSMKDQPRLIIRDRAEVGWNSLIVVSAEVIIEEDARISYDCRISDTDGHPQEADLRAAHRPPHPENIRPVRICRDAWIGNGTHIMKGVTIGQGAIVGANSVVTSSVPAYCFAMGNPARVFLKDFGLPTTASVPPATVPGSGPGTSAG